MQETPEIASGSAAPALLVVDDDDLVRDNVAEILGELRLRVFTAADGEQGVALLRANPNIAVAVTDMMMPRMGGLAFAIHARACRPGLKILFLSGRQFPPANEAFLPKPFLPAALIAAVKLLVNAST